MTRFWSLCACCFLCSVQQTVAQFEPSCAGLISCLETVIPSGAIMAFDRDRCPSGWDPFKPLDGRVVVGVGAGVDLTPRNRGDFGGKEELKLEPKHLPPHMHDVYPYAGVKN